MFGARGSGGGGEGGRGGEDVESVCMLACISFLGRLSVFLAVLHSWSITIAVLTGLLL